MTAGPYRRGGPLHGVRFVEFAGLGPVPFAAMILADLGAEGIRLEPLQPGALSTDPLRTPTNRGRHAVAIDLKTPAGREVATRLIARADVAIEGFRPGAMERLGLGPTECLAANPRLVYGRCTGWGQDGPYARRAGHDLTYLAAAGALHHFARVGQPPTPPLNLVADYGGGAMLLVAGVLAALVETARSGRGQVVDAAMVDGVALFMATVHGLAAQGLWHDPPGTNLLDTGAPFYDVYPAADGRYVAVAALEPRFFTELVTGLGLDPTDLPDQYDVAAWPVLRDRIATAIAGRDRDAWADHFAGTDACVAPVLSLAEAPEHPQLAARGTFTSVAGVTQAASAPRFSRTPAAAEPAPPTAPSATHLEGWGFTTDEVLALRGSGVVN